MLGCNSRLEVQEATASVMPAAFLDRVIPFNAGMTDCQPPGLLFLGHCDRFAMYNRGHNRTGSNGGILSHSEQRWIGGRGPDLESSIGELGCIGLREPECSVTLLVVGAGIEPLQEHGVKIMRHTLQSTLRG